MPASVHEKIISTATDILFEKPEGIRSGDLIKQRIPERLVGVVLPRGGGIHMVLSQYVGRPDALIYQPARGWFRHTKYIHFGEPPKPPIPPLDKIREDAFYRPFADWLVEELEECTKAAVIGGAALRDRWGTPDVMGILRPNIVDPVQFPIEVTSAEIKISTDALITAFGQACSYKLFSHKSYIVVPNTAPPEDIDRLDSLSLIFGIGLIVFDPASPTSPAFQIKTRATKHEPDMYYVNEKIARLGL